MHTTNPSQIPNRSEAISCLLWTGAWTLVIGSRFCKGNGREVPAYRKVGMKVLDIVTNFLGGLSVTDTQSGFRAYGKQAKGA
jgi:hypothetical protein